LFQQVLDLDTMVASVASAPRDPKWIPKKQESNIAAYMSNKAYWPVWFLIITAICVSGIGYFGGVAVSEIPPVVDFVTEKGDVIFRADQISHGEEIFYLRGLMSVGSFLGDGSERGPDYTAEALHVMATSVVKHYQRQLGPDSTQLEMKAAEIRMRSDLRNNTYNEKKNVVVLNEAMQTAWKDQVAHWKGYFQGPLIFSIEQIKKNQDVEDLSAFFFWGGWICAARRPGETTAGPTIGPTIRWLATLPPQKSSFGVSCACWFSLFLYSSPSFSTASSIVNSMKKRMRGIGSL
jgi:nitric oxide reductase large subunit